MHFNNKLCVSKQNELNISYYSRSNSIRLRVKEFMTDTWDAHNFSITLSQKLSSTKLKDYNLSQKQNKFKLRICRVKEFMTDTWDVHNYSTTLSQKSTKRIPIISSQT